MAATARGASRPQPLSAAKSAAFSRQARRDTAPELAVRRELHRRGLRYRVGVAPLPGRRRTADVVFPKAKVAVYVDGCFWHQCPEHGTLPRHNAQWWRDKLEANVRRDRETDAELAAAGWTVVRAWEHESASAAADRVQSAVAAAGT